MYMGFYHESLLLTEMYQELHLTESFLLRQPGDNETVILGWSALLILHL